MKKTNVCFFLVILILFFTRIAHAKTNFTTIKLPKSVTIDLPKNWVLMSNNRRITLDTWAESTLDLNKLPKVDSELPFAANYYVDGAVVGIINVRYYPKKKITQNDVKFATAADVRDFDQMFRSNMVLITKKIGTTLTSWEGTKKSIINGITTLITEYHRKSLIGEGIFRVRLVRVLAGSRSFTLTVSYLESQALLKNITDRIISSLKMTGYR